MFLLDAIFLLDREKSPTDSEPNVRLPLLQLSPTLNLSVYFQWARLVAVIN